MDEAQTVKEKDEYTTTRGACCRTKENGRARTR
jgi:hypothetical protein